VLAALGVDRDGGCPQCGRRLRVHDGWAGPAIRCRGSKCITGGAWAWPEWAAAKLWNLDVEPAARRIAGLLDDTAYMRTVSDLGQNESSVANHTCPNRRVRALELVKERLGG
jgi:hypothetical protein